MNLCLHFLFLNWKEFRTMKIIFLSCLFLSSVFSAYCQTETQLKAQLKKDPVFIRYNNARLALITGVVENKWGNLTANKEKLKKLSEKEGSYAEIKDRYRKAGVDSGYFIALNKMIITKGLLAKKYKAVIKSHPEVWKKVTKELTAAIPKPPPLN